MWNEGGWPLLAAVMCTVAAGTAAWLIFRHIALGAERVLQASAADSRLDSAALDARVQPWSWRWLWPMLRRLQPLLPAYLPPAYQAPVARLVSRSGLPRAVGPAHILAWQAMLLAGAGCALAVSVVAVVWLQGVDLMLREAPPATGNDRPVSAGAVGPPHDAFGGFGGAMVLGCIAAGAAVGVGAVSWPLYWLRRRADTRRREIERQLPFMLDLVVLCVQAGLNLQGALVESVRLGQPGALTEEISRVLADIRAGQPRRAAFEAFGQRADSPAIHSWIAAMVQAETFGVSLGPLLHAQAQAQRHARFERAERLALQAPVKMLLPLVLFIFPCTFIVIAFPLAVSMGVL